MLIYNTLSKKVEKFVSLEPKLVKMYVCGPTVYDYDHLGHARTYLGFDLLHRLLLNLGYTVKYVQNITDVGHLQNDAEVGADKVQKKAKELDKTVEQVVEYYTNAHFRDMDALNIIRPTFSPLASQHIEEIISFVTELINLNYAYITNQGNVYFSVNKDQDYGKLSNRGLAEILTGTRVESASDKRSPADFALWKSAPSFATEMIWDSPWGKGFPGWHIECSAMSRKYLGDTFDIHGSAIEHIFPHHENEIAQTESVTGSEMARYWVHTGMLNVNGVKMSKSAHNFITVQDALKKYSFNEIRLAIYLTHYRKPFDYTDKVMEQGVALRRKIFLAYYNSKEEDSNNSICQEILEPLKDDLDSPRALQLLIENLDKLSKKQFKIIFEVLGLKYHPIDSNSSLTPLIKQREDARQAGDYLTSDNRKAEIENKGYEVIDTSDSTIYLSR